MQTSRILALGGFAAFAAMSVEAGGAETLLEALRGLAPSSIVSERIVGGDPTSQNEWPWQNALYFRGADGHQYFDCGGSLIAWFLMTAAEARLMISLRMVSETGRTSSTAARPW